MKHFNPSSLATGALLTVGATATLAVPSPAQGTETVTRILTLTSEQQEILSYLSLEMIDDGTGNLVPTIRVNGANLQVVNGLGSTQTTNSAGNLIVGYNEPGNIRIGDHRTGSHNISFGEGNSFSSFGGLVGPKGNSISAELRFDQRWPTQLGKRSLYLDQRWAAQQYSRNPFLDQRGRAQPRRRRRVLDQRWAEQYDCRSLLLDQRGRDNDTYGEYSSVTGGPLQPSRSDPLLGEWRKVQCRQRKQLLDQRWAWQRDQRELLISERWTRQHDERSLLLSERWTRKHDERSVLLCERGARQLRRRARLFGQRGLSQLRHWWCLFGQRREGEHCRWRFLLGQRRTESLRLVYGRLARGNSLRRRLGVGSESTVALRRSAAPVSPVVRGRSQERPRPGTFTVDPACCEGALRLDRDGHIRCLIEWMTREPPPVQDRP